MFIENDLSNGFVHGIEISQMKSKEEGSMQNLDNPEGRIGFQDKGSDLLRESEIDHDGFCLKPAKNGNSGFQELTLSYLCDKSKMSFQEKEIPGKNFLSSLEKGRYKGKEVVSDSPNGEERWVERDFLQLSGSREGGSKTKREIEEEIEREQRDNHKKPKMETLNLSLALPDVCVSLSLASSNPLPNAEPPVLQKPTRSINTHTTCSDDFTAASLSYSYSHPFSHNPSCSLTRNSTENYEYSVGSRSHRRENDQIWNCGEGTNGSVHSRFKPVGDGVNLSNHGGNVYGLMQINKDSCNSLYRTTSSDNQSFFPSELPAKPWKETRSGDSRVRGSDKDKQRVLENSDGGRGRKLSRPERILREIVSESIPVMAQTIQELPEETIESTKEYLRNLITVSEKREEFAGLRDRLERRSDLTFEVLSKCQKTQLDILISVKTGITDYLSGKNQLPTSELVEVFLLMRCRNLLCKNLLPVDDCDCKICSTKGFCSACMCPICLNFDCASNTCSWVGCDVCSHWCHAECGIQRHLIKPGPSLKGPSGTTEMQFHCIGCGHASEMFGFVKDVFMCCANDWGLETLIKELDCVKKIFRGSEDFKGKELHSKAEEMLSKLKNKIISPSDACNFILQFFKYGGSEFSGSGISSKDSISAQVNQRKDASLPQSSALPPKSSTYNVSPSSTRRDILLPRDDAHQNEHKVSLVNDRGIEDNLRSGPLAKKSDFDSLESIVRIKEAEARMFQSKADDARREAEGYRQMVRLKSEKLDEEYAGKLAKLCLKETEERRRKKLEELKVLENSHCDYYNMKIRMQAEIAGLLERMEATKQQWV